MFAKVILFCVLYLSAVLCQEERKCNTVEGSLRGCHECYPCDSNEIIEQKKFGVLIQELKLYNASCVPTHVCCMSKWDAIANRFGGECGVARDANDVRSSPREVVQGEYPWQAFVYRNSSDETKMLCSATFINEETLLTSAYCVKDIPLVELRVSFNIPSKSDDVMIELAMVTVHEGYDDKTRKNDIALLKVKSTQKIPSWASDVCLPSHPAPYASSCITLSKNYNFIRQDIPLTQLCTNQPKHEEGQTCAVLSPIEEEISLPAAGLYCESRDSADRKYTLHGIFLYKEGDVAIFTDVWEHNEWIQEHN